MEKRLLEIMARKVEIRSALETNKEINLEEIQTELAKLDTEERSIQTKMEIAGKINTGEIRGKAVPILKEKTVEYRNVEDQGIEYRKAFMDYVLKGTEIPAELRVAGITNTADIGSMIPETVLNKIIEKIEAAGMILPLITRTAFKGGLSIPTSSVKPVATWVAEGVGSASQKKTTSKIVFAYHKLRCAIAVTLEVDVMALSAFEATFIANVTEAMVKAIEQSIISGSGEGQPTGILEEVPASGQAITGTPVYAKLIEAEGALPLEYENGAVWCMTKKTFMAFIGEVDDMGQPIARVNYGIAGKPERILLGRPVVLCNYISTYSAGLTVADVWAFLFNFSDYALNTNYNMTIKKYEDNVTDDMVTKAIMIADGKVVDKNSLVTLIR